MKGLKLLILRYIFFLRSLLYASCQKPKFHSCSCFILSLSHPPNFGQTAKKLLLHLCVSSSHPFPLFPGPLKFYLVKEKGNCMQILNSICKFIRVQGVNRLFQSKDENFIHSQARGMTGNEKKN